MRRALKNKCHDCDTRSLSFLLDVFLSDVLTLVIFSSFFFYQTIFDCFYPSNCFFSVNDIIGIYSKCHVLFILYTQSKKYPDTPYIVVS